MKTTYRPLPRRAKYREPGLCYSNAKLLAFQVLQLITNPKPRTNVRELRHDESSAEVHAGFRSWGFSAGPFRHSRRESRPLPYSPLSGIFGMMWPSTPFPSWWATVTSCAGSPPVSYGRERGLPWLYTVILVSSKLPLVLQLSADALQGTISYRGSSIRYLWWRACLGETKGTCQEGEEKKKGRCLTSLKLWLASGAPGWEVGPFAMHVYYGYMH